MSTTRFTNGVTTASPAETLGRFVALDPTKVIAYFNDFHTYAAGDWVVTETSAGATQALGDGLGGLLVLTATAADNDLIGLQLAKEGFLIQAGKEAWFKARFKVSDATQSDLLMGLHITDTSPVASAPTDGIVIRKDDGDALLDGVVLIDNAAASTSTGIGTLVDDTFITVGFHFDGASVVRFYVNDAEKAAVTLTAANIAALDDETLALSFAFQTGEAEAQVSTVDYVFAAVER